jgi:hypothetical protein
MLCVCHALSSGDSALAFHYAEALCQACAPDGASCTKERKPRAAKTTEEVEDEQQWTFCLESSST